MHLRFIKPHSAGIHDGAIKRGVDKVLAERMISEGFAVEHSDDDPPVVSKLPVTPVVTQPASKSKAKPKAAKKTK